MAFTTFQSLAQVCTAPSFEHYTADEGLSSNSVWAVMQDEKGFIWLATSYGLNRFDGQQFKTWTHNPQDSTSLGFNRLKRLYPGSNGDIWISSIGQGLSRYRHRHNDFVNYHYSDTNSQTLYSDEVNNLFTDSKGQTWASTTQGLNLYLPEKDAFARVPVADSSQIGAVYEIAEMPAGTLWLATRGGLYRAQQQEDKSYTLVCTKLLPPYTSAKAVLADTLTHKLWVTTEKGDVFQFLPGSRQQMACLESVNYPDGKLTSVQMVQRNRSEIWIRYARDYISRLLLDEDGNLLYSKNYFQQSASGEQYAPVTMMHADSRGGMWVATDGNGLHHMPAGAENFKQYAHHPAQTGSISGNSVVCLLEDRQRGLWAGTFGAGLNYLPDSNKGFSFFTETPRAGNSENCLRGKVINGFFERPDSLVWVASNGGGLHLFNPATGTFRRYAHNPQDPFSLPSDKVVSVLQDRQGRVWAGTAGNGLACMQQETGRFTRYGKAQGLRDSYIFCLLEDRKGRVWAGHRKGIDLLLPGKDKFVPVDYVRGIPSAVALLKYVWSVKQHTNGTIWIASEGDGLFVFNPETGTASHIQNLSDPEGRSTTSTVWAVAEGQRGMVWLGTGHGLFRYNPGTGETRAFTSLQGLPNNVVYSIIADKDGFVWAATIGGLARFDPQTETFFNFYKEDGLGGNDFMPAALEASDGTFYFGGTHGFNSFIPKNLKDRNLQVPPLAITRIRLNMQELSPGVGQDVVLQAPVHVARQLQIPHGSHLLTVEFAALNFINPHKNEYAYRLEPLQKEWQYTGRQPLATFTNLSPGEYVLHLKGSNNDRVWNEAGISMNILIPPPWWKTRWAMALFVLGVMSLLAGGVSYRFASLQRQRQKLEKLVEVRTSEVLRQNSEITVQKQAMQEQNQVLEERNHRLQDLNREYKGLMNVVAHDLKSPLNRVRGLLELMSIELKGGDTQQQYTDMAFRVIDDGILLIQDLLDLQGFSENRQVQLQPENVDLPALFNSVFDSYQTRLQNKRITLKASLEPAQITTDVLSLQRVVDNLFSNAVKFTPPGRSIMVDLRQTTDGQHMVLQVADEGPGFRQEDLPHMFKMFRKLSAQPTAGESSNGLGLAIVKVLVERLNGEITVENRPARGACFTIKLPQT